MKEHIDNNPYTTQYVTQVRSGGPPGPITGRRSGQNDAERQQLVGAICLRSLEGPRASNATSQAVLGRNR